jgi:hypothetical protein
MGISKHDKQALAQLFIDMGVPLVVAMQTVESWGGEQKSQADRAQELAKLLNLSVEFATKLTKKLGIRDSYTLENIRSKIIRIVTPIVSERYISKGAMPDAADLDGLTDLFDVLISFSDSVSPTGDDKTKADDMAIFIAAIEPVISVVQSESDAGEMNDLLSNITKSLMGRTNGLADDLGIENTIQSGLLKSVSQTFISCYKAHKGKDMDAIWSDCDERLSIVCGLTKFVGQNVGIEPSKEKPKDQESKRKVESVKQKSAQAETPKAENDDSDGDDDEFNPMAFFSAGGK